MRGLVLTCVLVFLFALSFIPCVLSISLPTKSDTFIDFGQPSRNAGSDERLIVRNVGVRLGEGELLNLRSL